MGKQPMFDKFVTGKEFFLVWMSSVVSVCAKAIYDQMVPTFRTGLNVPEWAHQIIDPISGVTFFAIGMLLITGIIVAAGSWFIRWITKR
jgi:hypothetical protein